MYEIYLRSKFLILRCISIFLVQEFLYSHLFSMLLKQYWRGDRLEPPPPPQLNQWVVRVKCVKPVSVQFTITSYNDKKQYKYSNKNKILNI